MANEEIIGGLRTALEKGQSLRSAMMSFYNSGYKKEEIEEAARALYEVEAETRRQEQEVRLQQMQRLKKSSSGGQLQQIPLPVKGQQSQQHAPLQQYQQQPQPQAQMQQAQQVQQMPQNQQTVQKVSNYGEKKKSNIKIIIFAIILGILLTGLVLVFLFRSQIIDFFNQIS